MPVSPIAVSQLSRVSPASAAIRLAILGAAALISIPLSAAQNGAAQVTSQADAMTAECLSPADCKAEHL